MKLYYPVLILLLALGCTNPKEVVSPPITVSESQRAAIPQKDASSERAVIYISKDIGRTWQPFAQGLPADATVSCFLESGHEIFATTEFHGVYRTNGGGQWQAINNGLPQKVHIKAIVAMGKILVLGTSGNGIFISENDGNYWQYASGVLDKIPVRCLAAFAGTLFAGTDAGIYSSKDKGKTWKHVYENIQINGFTALGNKLYAGVVNGAIMSEDNGATWRRIFQPNTLHDISNDGHYIYAMTLRGGLLRSADDGAHWENANEGLGTLNLYTFEVKNIGADLFAGQWIGIYHSVNAGDSWELLTGGLPDSTAFSTLEVTDAGILAGVGLRN